MQFEKDNDPFHIDELIKDATSGAGSGTKRYGMQQDESETRSSKRARVEDDDR